MISSKQQPDKVFPSFHFDWDEELVSLWRLLLEHTKSDVLCESCGVTALFPKPISEMTTIASPSPTI